jgi:hypothetical protein
MKAFGRRIGLVAAGALLGVGATGCKGPCDDQGSCGEYSGPEPKCDGYFHYLDGGICDTCAKRDDAGVWRYPDGTVRREPGDLGPCGDGGTDGGADGNGVCPANARPDTDACAISDEYGIFVSPTGNDESGDGRHATPLRTLAAGLQAAKASSKRLYVCANAGVFAEQLTLSAENDGVDVYGGFDCMNLDQWTYSIALQTAIEPADRIGSTIDGLVAGATLQDLKITAGDATTAGDSSFGMIVNGSQNVLLRRVTITAGKGAAGARGTDGSSGPAGEQPGDAQKGANASCAAGLPSNQNGGSWGSVNSCGSSGGSGGLAFLDGAKAGDSGAYGVPQTYVTPENQQNGGLGATTAGANGSPGGPGSNGNSGANGSPAPQVGTFSSTGYTPANGSDGTDGFPGQGGGGGGASKGNGTCIGASGGAGGMGGCGGTKGRSRWSRRLRLRSFRRAIHSARL